MRWNKKYDGTIESIEDKSHRPHGRHPNAHTNQEITRQRYLYWYEEHTPENTVDFVKRVIKFYSLEDLREQGKRYLKRSNNIPIAVLKYQTPQEKRTELETFGMVKYAI